MAVSTRTNRLIWVQAAGRCSICRKELIEPGTDTDAEVAFGAVAHIVAQSPEKGPRSGQPIPGEDVDGPDNLLLLCRDHHEVVDSQVAYYTIERLLGIKESHIQWVREQFGLKESGAQVDALVTNTVYSSVMAVDQMPMRIYTASCDLRENDVRPHIAYRTAPGAALPYIVREQKLITFARLTDEPNPFSALLKEPGTVEQHAAADWWADKDLSRWYVDLLNRTLNKLTGWRGLNWDRDHRRYYFEPERDENGALQPHHVPYRPLNAKQSTRAVVWRPTKRRTGEQRNYWTHLAVGLRFQRVTGGHWVLAMRPELRYTIDGFTPLVPKATGRRATSKKSKLYNYQLLAELHFWQEYLSEGKPNIIIDLFGQSLVIDARLLSGTAEWPGIPGDERAFVNVQAEHDLFTISEYARAIDGDEGSDAELEPWEADDLSELEQMTWEDG